MWTLDIEPHMTLLTVFDLSIYTIVDVRMVTVRAVMCSIKPDTGDSSYRQSADCSPSEETSKFNSVTREEPS